MPSPTRGVLQGRLCETGSGVVVAGAEGRGNREMSAKAHTLLATGCLRTGDLMDSLASAISNDLLCTWSFPAGKASTCQRRGRRFDPCVGKVSWRRKWQPTPVFLPGKSHGRRSLAGCRLQGRKRGGHCLVTKQQEQTGYLKVKSGFCKTCCWSIAALRCAVRFCCRAKWISCTYASFPSALDFLAVWVTAER